MAKKIRFPLQMNETNVRTIEELRENFDLESVLGYFANGKLVTWLRDHYYDDEAMAVETLNVDDTDLNQKLMSILGVSIDLEIEEIDMGAIQRRNEKLMLLRQITDDKEIIDNIDSVAFNQDDLFDILDEGVKEIYLCQGDFEIPLNVKNITYHGIDNPSVSLRKTKKATVSSSNIKFVGITIPEISNDDNTSNDSESKYIDWIVNKANEGDAKAQYKFGCLYETGNGIQKDINKAIQWYHKSADNGNCDAMYRLGQLYQPKITHVSGSSLEGTMLSFMDNIIKSVINPEQTCEIGEHITPDIKTAIRFYQAAADKGHAMAQTELGNHYYFGDGVKQSYENAIEWYRKAVKQNCAVAQNNLGECYANGHGVSQDWDNAIELYKKSAEQGYAVAQYNLGDFYQQEGSAIAESLGCGEDEYYNEVAQASFKKAIEWYRKAAEQENKEAQFSLGWCYQYGQGVLPNIQEAVIWYQKSARQGHERSQKCLKLLGKTW